MSKKEAYLAMQLQSRDEFLRVIRKELMDVGVPRFNEEHVGLLENFLNFHTILEEFRTNHVSEAGWRNVAATLAALTDYSNTHLNAEEAALTEIAYPDLANHLAAHDRFRAMLGDYGKAAAARDVTGIFGLKYDLFDWFYDHINSLDLRYAPYMRGTA